MGRRTKRSILLAIAVVVIVVLLYLPVALAVSASWVHVYSGVPAGNATIDPTVPIYFPLSNEAPFSIPGFNPEYLMSVAITNGSTKCSLLTLDGFIPCSTSTYVSVGSVMPGQAAYAVVYLTPDSKSFTIQASGYLQFLSQRQRLSSVTYQCTYVGTGQSSGTLDYPYAYSCKALH